MTLSTTTNVVRYTAAGGQTVFPYTFRVDDSDHMEVYRNGSLLASGYSLSGVGSDSGGNVTLTTGADANDNITLRRKVPLTQSLDLPTQGALNTDALEADGLDRGVMIDQQQEEELGRTFKAPVESSVSDLTLTPSASQLIGWNAAGDALVNYDPDGATSSPATAFAKTLLDDATAAAVLTTLGVSSFIQTLLDDTTAAAARSTLGAKVLGIKTVTSTTEVSTTSTSWTDPGSSFDMSYALADASNSLLLVLFSSLGGMDNNGQFAQCDYRWHNETAASDLTYQLTRSAGGQDSSGDVQGIFAGAIAAVATPATTTSQTYAPRYKVSGAGGSEQAYFGIGNSNTIVIAVEFTP